MIFLSDNFLIYFYLWPATFSLYSIFNQQTNESVIIWSNLIVSLRFYFLFLLRSPFLLKKWFPNNLPRQKTIKLLSIAAASSSLAICCCCCCCYNCNYYYYCCCSCCCCEQIATARFSLLGHVINNNNNNNNHNDNDNDDNNNNSKNKRNKQNIVKKTIKEVFPRKRLS